MDIHGRVALVTGGSRGIGAAIAERLAMDGADVAISFLADHAAADLQAARIRSHGRRALTVEGDLADPPQVVALAQRVAAELGPIEILVSNAGIGPQQSLADISVDDWNRVMDVNLRPAFLLAQQVAPGMVERGWGRIVLISSVAAFTGGIVGPHYAASKAGMLGLMHSLASALAPSGVTVNAVAPALIAEGSTLPGDAEAHAQLASRVPLGRLGTTGEVAQAVVAIVRNSFITAQTLLVDGGIYPH